MATRSPSRAEPCGGHALADLVGHHAGALAVGLGEEHDELVAAEAGRGVDAADVLADDGGHGGQGPVARPVAERVVELLEAVEVGHQDAEAAPVARRPVDLPLHGRQDVAPGWPAR